MRNKKHLLLILLVATLFSCEEETDWNFQTGENGALVVEAILTNEFKIQKVVLSQSYDELNGESVGITDAQVKVSGGGTVYTFAADPDHAGRYLSMEPFAAQLQPVYTLEVLWNGTTYLAENKMRVVFPFNKLTFKPSGRGDSLTLGEVAPLYHPLEQAMYEIDIYWLDPVNVDTAHAKLFFYTFSSVDVNEIFRPTKETVVFPRGSLVIEKKYSLNPEFAAYYRALLMETEWQGGVFDEASGSLPTNVSNGGLGFFGVSAVRSDTLIAQ